MNPTAWRPRWWADRWAVLASVACAYGPVVASSPGWVGADTKTYLYLDPGRLLARAPTLWDADRALGTVTHQNIGYLWPMGPFYWLTENLGLPDWLAQRLWLGTLLAAAGLGVRYLLRTLGFQCPGLLIAVLGYQLSPYLLHYSARISIVLAPWAGLGWLIGLTVRAARAGGWRYPALFALAAVTVGSANATSLALVGLAPALWLVHAAGVERSVTWRRAGAAAGRIGLLTAAVSLWWMAGLAVQGAYSLPVTRYTETYKAVADASTAPEILRGLGYWFFYGNDKLGAWIEPSVDYTQGLWLVFVSFGLTVGTLALAAALRWRHRGYFLLLLVVGALIGVGAHPWDGPSPAGALFKAFTRTDAGLALRSTPRAVPLVALSVAVLAAAGVGALQRRMPRLGSAVGAGVLLAVVLNNPAMWKIRMVEEHLRRPEELPQYWLEAAADLDRAGPGRVWEVPGSDFASYRWGNTVDPITPGLIDRGYVARELVPFGSAPSAALLTAVDRRLQEQTLEAESLAQVARLMGVSEIVHRADLTFERFRTPRPVQTAAWLERAPGLVPMAAYGDPAPNEAGPEQTMIDEIRLSRTAEAIHPAPVTRFGVAGARPAVGTRPRGAATVVVGDADGIVDAAAAGAADFAGGGPVFFAADLVSAPDLAELVLGAGGGVEPAGIVVTDSNRRRAQRWGTLRENRGYTEAAGETPLAYDPTDNRLAVFGSDPTDDTRTVSEQRGPVSARATAYGNPVTYTVDDRPALAVDGSPDTAWVVGAFSDPRGEILRLELAEPGPVASVTLLQPRGPANRRITEVEIRADGRAAATVGLDQRSRTEPGQTVALGMDASVIEIEITATDLDHLKTYPGIDPVGFAEADLGLGPTTEVIRTPRALLDRLGERLNHHDLTVVLTRERSDPREPVRTDPEPQMVRAVPLPVERQATLQGTARLSAATPSPLIDDLLGLKTNSQSKVTATSSGRLAGDLPSRASAVLDGDPTTAWTAAFGPQTGRWIEIAVAPPTLNQTFDQSTPTATEVETEVDVEVIEVDVVTDRLHSLPTAFEVLVDGVSAGVFPTGLSADEASASAPIDSATTVSIPIRASGNEFRLVTAEVSERLTRDWYSNTFQPLPVSIAEVRIGANPVQLGPPTPMVDTGCRDDLVKLNGHPTPVRITGSAADAEARRPLNLQGCRPVTLTPNETLVVTASGADTGIDIDQLVLTSPAPTQPTPTKPQTEATPPESPTLAPSGPTDSASSPGEVKVERHRDTSLTATVPPSDTGRWLVLAQSHNRGWQAVANGVDLGEPVLIDGYANGWWLPPGDETTVELRWNPQRLVDAALALSAVFTAITIALAWKGRREHHWEPHQAVSLGPPLPYLPQLVWPFFEQDPQTSRASLRAAATAALATSAIAAFTLPQWPIWLPVAAALGATAAITLRRQRAKALPLAAAATSLGAAAAWIMISQRRFRHPPDFGWPQRFEEVHILGVTTILLAATAYLCESLQTRQGDET